MRLIDEFNRFLVEEVNLNQSRIDDLEAKAAAIARFVKGSDWGPAVREFSHQGSWEHGTIIKPPGSRGFDADLLAFVDPVDGWGAADYVEELYHAFRASGTYEDKVSRQSRCVTIDYAGDFHLDLIPCVINRSGDTRLEVCNRISDAFEATDGTGYATWWHGKNATTGSDRLKHVTRLLKYLRDVKVTFSVKSILLTTLIGERITMLDGAPQGGFEDLPMALRTVIGHLDDYLRLHPEMPTISNPVLRTEHFVRHWDEAKYANFRSRIHTYRGWVDEAYAEADLDESIAKWRRVFGDGFGAGAVIAEARSIKDQLIAPPALRSANDVVGLVRALGRSILDGMPTSLAWVQRSRWRMVGSMTVAVRASLHEDRSEASRLGPLASGQVIPKQKDILFEAVNSMGSPFPKADYEVWWRVVNTDGEAAADVRQLRGGFYESEAGPGKRWETTQYHGAHWVEAFVVRNRDRVCVAQSERFFVVID